MPASLPIATPKVCHSPDKNINNGIATTNQKKDPKNFNGLRTVMYRTLAIEMEGAEIAKIAQRRNIRYLIVKAVSDHADEEKDDSYREFACRASANVLLTFLLHHLDPTAAQKVPQPSTPATLVATPAVISNVDLTAKHTELVKHFDSRLSAFTYAREWLNDPKLLRMCEHAPPTLIENWLKAMHKHPRDRGAAGPSITAIWKEALDLGLVPPLAALDRRVDLQELTRINLEKRAFWGALSTETPRIFGERVCARKATLGWNDGAWEPRHALAGPLFEWVWDVLRATHNEKIPVEKFLVRWWGAGSGVVRFVQNIEFPWPVAEMVYFYDHHEVADVWNEKYERAVRLAQNLPNDQRIIDDLAFWFVEAQHQRWHRPIAFGIDGEDWRTSERNWKSSVAHLLDSVTRGDPSEFGDWARSVPLLAAPESVFNDEADSQSIAGANMEPTSRPWLHELRLRRARYVMPEQDPSKVIATIDVKFPEHPWVKAFEQP